MECSDDIEDESPCFIVPDSQIGDQAVIEGCESTVDGLKPLAMLRSVISPVDEATNMISSTTDEKPKPKQPMNGISDSSSVESVGPNSTPPSSNSTNTPLSTSSSNEDLDKTHAKKHVLFNHEKPENITQGSKVFTSTPALRCDAIKTQETHWLLDGNSLANPFECLQLSGDIIVKETSSSDEIISPSIEDLKPSTPLPDLEDSDKDTKQARTTSKGNFQNDANLPKWQKDFIEEENETSSLESVAALSRKTSNSSSCNNKIVSSVNDSSSLQQWQSPQDGSDDLFGTDETTCSSANIGETKMAVPLPVTSEHSQHQPLKSPALPEMSQDIFHCRPKGKTDDQMRANKDCSPPDEIILSSQDQDGFVLYLSQSQKSNLPSQRHMDADLIVNGPVTKDACKSTGICELQHCDEAVSAKEQKIVETNQHSEPKLRSSPELTESGHMPFHFSPPSVLLRPVVTTTPSPCLEDSFENQTESLIGPLPEGMETTSNFGPVLADVAQTKEISPVVPEGATALSFSAPISGRESVDEEVSSQMFEFKLQKDDNVVDPKTIKPTKKSPVRSVFTSIRDRCQAPSVQSFGEDSDPFEFKDDAGLSSLWKRERVEEVGNGGVARERFREHEPKACTKRKQRDDEVVVLEERAVKRRPRFLDRSHDIDHAGVQTGKKTGLRRKLWKIVQSKTIITTTTMVEREIVVKYTDEDGELLKSETTHEFDEPTYSTRVRECKETRDLVADIPGLENIPNNSETSGTSTASPIVSGPGQRSSSPALVPCPEGSVESSPVLRSSSPTLVPCPEDLIERSPSPASTCHQSKNRKPSLAEQRALRSTSEANCKSDREVPSEGSRVLAQWFDKHYYPGILLAKSESDSKCRVQFDDGDVGFIQEDNLLAVDYLPRDQPVMFCQGNEECYDYGVIRGFYRNGSERGYKIAPEDGGIIKCPRSNVILDMDQAAIFLSLQSSASNSTDDKQNEYSPDYDANVSDGVTRSDRTDAGQSRRPKFAEQASTSGGKVTKVSRSLRRRKSQTSPRKIASSSRLPSDRTAGSSRTSPKEVSSSPPSFLATTVSGKRKSTEKRASASRIFPDKTASGSQKSRDKTVTGSLRFPDKTASSSRRSPEKTASGSRRSSCKRASGSRRSPDKTTRYSKTSADDATKRSLPSREFYREVAPSRRACCSETSEGLDPVPTTSRNTCDGGERSDHDDLVATQSRSPPKSARHVLTFSSSETPKSTRKSTTKKDSVGKRGGSSGNQDTERPVSKVRTHLSSAMKAAVAKSSPGPSRTSPRKSVAKQARNENLIVPTNRDLFRGYGFVITGSDVNSASGGDENSPTEEDVSFRRNQVICQVKVAGGVALKDFREHSVDESYILLSNSCQTTAKYFYALVSGVPCLSHVWVRDCCRGNSLLNYNNYLLPAGKDLITGRLVEEQKCTRALRGMKVYLVGNEEFKMQWKKVLTVAGCDIVNKLPTNVLKEIEYGNQEMACDVIVVGSGDVSHSTVLKAQLLGVPTVTIHWLKQCILTGKRVPFNAHRSFIYKGQEN